MLGGGQYFVPVGEAPLSPPGWEARLYGRQGCLPLPRFCRTAPGKVRRSDYQLLGAVNTLLPVFSAVSVIVIITVCPAPVPRKAV